MGQKNNNELSITEENSLRESADDTVEENCSFSASFPRKKKKEKEKCLRQSHNTRQMETWDEWKLGFGTHSMRDFRTRVSGED